MPETEFRPERSLKRLKEFLIRRAGWGLHLPPPVQAARGAGQNLHVVVLGLAPLEIPHDVSKALGFG